MIIDKLVLAARKLLNSLPKICIRAAQWKNHRWNTEYCESKFSFMVSYSLPVPGLLEWACPEQLGLSSIACRLVLDDSIRPCTNGLSLLHQIASAALLNKPQNTSYSVLYTSGTIWNTRSDRSG